MFRALESGIREALHGCARDIFLDQLRVGVARLFDSKTVIIAGVPSRFFLAIVASIFLHLLLIARFGNLSSLGATPRSMALQATIVSRVPSETEGVNRPSLEPADKTLPSVDISKKKARTPAPDRFLKETSKVNTERRDQSQPNEVAEKPSRPLGEMSGGSAESRVTKPVMPDPIPIRASGVDEKSTRVQNKNSDLLNGVSFPQFTTPLRFVEIGFEYSSGLKDAIKNVGSGTHKYEADQAGNFRISAEEALPVKSTKGNKWNLSISGKIYGHGLFPIGFSSKGALPDRLLAINGAANSVDGRGSGRSGRMPDGIPDRQTLLYHFMVRAPTLPEGKIAISDGEDVATYNYVLTDVESFRLEGFGEVRAIKLRFFSEQRNDLIEIWLAPTLHFLPLKVRFTDKDGNVLEQLVVSLRYE